MNLSGEMDLGSENRLSKTSLKLRASGMKSSYAMKDEYKISFIFHQMRSPICRPAHLDNDVVSGAELNERLPLLSLPHAFAILLYLGCLRCF